MSSITAAVSRVELTCPCVADATVSLDLAAAHVVNAHGVRTTSSRTVYPGVPAGEVPEPGTGEGTIDGFGITVHSLRCVLSQGEVLTTYVDTVENRL